MQTHSVRKQTWYRSSEYSGTSRTPCWQPWNENTKRPKQVREKAAGNLIGDKMSGKNWERNHIGRISDSEWNCVPDVSFVLFLCWFVSWWFIGFIQGKERRWKCQSGPLFNMFTDTWDWLHMSTDFQHFKTKLELQNVSESNFLKTV